MAIEFGNRDMKHVFRHHRIRRWATPVCRRCPLDNNGVLEKNKASQCQLQLKLTDSSGGQVNRRRTPETSGSDNQH